MVTISIEIPADKLKKAKEIIASVANEMGLIWYSKLYEKIGLDHANPGHRQIGSNILGTISQESNAHDGIMLSALVTGKYDGEPADGFYDLAQEIGRLSVDASDIQKSDFWVKEVDRVHKFYNE